MGPGGELHQHKGALLHLPGEDRRTAHVRDSRQVPGQIAEQIQVVRAHVHQRSPAPFLRVQPPFPLLPGHPLGQMGPQLDDLSQTPLLDNPPDLLVDRPAAQHEANFQVYAGPLAGSDHLPAFRYRHGHRLLAEHVLSLSRRGQHVLAVPIDRAGHVHRVHLGIAQQPLRAIPGPGGAEFRGQALGPVQIPHHQRLQRASGMRVQRRHHPTLGHIAGAQHAPSHHRRSSCEGFSRSLTQSDIQGHHHRETEHRSHRGDMRILLQLRFRYQLLDHDVDHRAGGK